MIRLLFLLIINQFATALRKRPARPEPLGKAWPPASGAAGAVAEVHPVAMLMVFRCGPCDHGVPFQPSRFRRITPATSLERFLAHRGISQGQLRHAAMHVSDYLGIDLFPDERLRDIRKGTAQPTASERDVIALAVSSLLEEPVDQSILFAGEPPAAARRRA